MSRVFLLYPTHTTRHLAAALGSVAQQTSPPDGVVLTCDTDDAEIESLAQETWARVRRAGPGVPPLLYTSRAHTGEPRLNQVRNNGLRALDATYNLGDDDLVVVVDGDTVLEPEGVAKYRARASSDVVIPYRVELTEPETDALGSRDWIDGSVGWASGVLDGARLRALSVRRDRYKRQLRFKWVPGLVKAHKPKVIGGHHAVRARVLRAVNGYDEMFRGNGTDDDDLARRVHMLRREGQRVVVDIAVGEIHAFHLFHPTRRPWRVSEAPDHARFMAPRRSPRAEPGWDCPREQPEVRVVTIDPASVGVGAGTEW